MLRVEDKTLKLPDGRTLAYADHGNTSSQTVVLFLHGAFRVGDASRPPTFLLERNIHYIAPSLPGWGRSSPVTDPARYAATLIADITTLLKCLHPQEDISKLYISGHSFGTIPVQMLCEASFDEFPFGRYITAVILLAPHSPPHRHRDYAKYLSWPAYLISGPPARYMPFNLFGYIIKLAVSNNLKTEGAAEAFGRKTMFDLFNEEEIEAYTSWKEEYSLEEGIYEKEIGKTLAMSVANSWQGFLDLPTIYQYGWGKASITTNKSRLTAPVLIVSSAQDDMAPAAMANWLANYFLFAQIKIISGGHTAALFRTNEIWKEVWDWTNS